MARVKLRMPVKQWNTMMGVLNAVGIDAPERTELVGAAVSDIMSESVLDEYDVVEMKIETKTIEWILSILNPAYEDEADTDYVRELIVAREEHRAQQAVEKAKRDEYNAWLNACIAKYADDASLNCKDITALINANDLKPGMEPLRYQSIMRHVKAYRAGK